MILQVSTFLILANTIPPPALGIINLSVRVGKPIIFVSMNYRLNTFGFLASANVPSEDLNAGLLDQKAALVFIQENIARFGGDPSKVLSFPRDLYHTDSPIKITLWGQSSGAGSVEAQMLYATEPTLFRAVIADSSTGPFKNAPYAWQYDKPGMPYSRLLTATGCPAGPGSITRLQQVPYEIYNLFFDNGMIGSTFDGQLWEHTIGPVGSFVPGRSSERILSGKYHHVPYLGGTNVNEGSHISQTLYNLSLSPSEQNAAFHSWVFQTVVDNSTLTPNVIAGIDTLFPTLMAARGTLAICYMTGRKHGTRIPCFLRRDGSSSSMVRHCSPCGDAILQSLSREHRLLSVVSLSESCHLLNPLNEKRTVYLGSESLFIFGPVPDIAQTEFANQITEYWINFVHDMNPRPYVSNLSHRLKNGDQIRSYSFLANWPAYDTSSKYVIQLMRNNITLIPDGEAFAGHVSA
ncbi:Alpha/Beta hydrolase protein [Chiua virens]|nr:Alpha/Beta hydrolase protein [Chiua virens]